MRNARNVLMAYIDSFALHDIAGPIEARLRVFVASRTWAAQEVIVVNEQHPPFSEDQPDDLPPWSLGLNLTLSEKDEKREDWREDVRATVKFLAGLHDEFGEDFALALHDRASGFNEDVAFVTSSRPDVADILSAIDTHRA